MSHLATVKSQLKSIEAIRMACRELGVVLREGGRARYFNARQSDECDFTIELPKPHDRYSVGLKRQPDGTFALVADDMVAGWDTKLGRNYGKFKQEVSFATLRLEAQRKGLRLTREMQPNGTLLAVMTGRF